MEFFNRLPGSRREAPGLERLVLRKLPLIGLVGTLLPGLYALNARLVDAGLPPAELRPDAPPGESSDVIRARVVRARERQRARAGRCNAHLDQSETNAVCRLAPDDQAMLENAIDLLQLSARSMHRILRVARTIADLAGSPDILGPHVAEAIGYRRGERAGTSRAA